MDGKLKGKESSFFFVVVAVMLCSALLIANVLSTLIAPYSLWGIFNLSGGFIMFPITFILSDVISEVYGYDKSRKISWLAAGVNLFVSLFFIFMYNLLGPDRAAGIEQLARNSWIVTIASIISFQLGNWTNDVIFQMIKKRQERFFWIRSLVSSIGGELVDSAFFVFAGLTIAFHLPFSVGIVMIFSQVTFKLLVEFILLPITYGTRAIGRHYDPDVFRAPEKYGIFGG